MAIIQYTIIKQLHTSPQLPDFKSIEHLWNIFGDIN